MVEWIERRGDSITVRDLQRSSRAHASSDFALRHSSLDLTMNIYTDPVLLDVGAAVDALPPFTADRHAVLATGKA